MSDPPSIVVVVVDDNVMRSPIATASALLAPSPVDCNSDSDSSSSGIIDIDECEESTVTALSSLPARQVQQTSIPFTASTPSSLSFSALRFNYLLVTVAIMLADGLQGTK
jgi:hypothetical protein